MGLFDNAVTDVAVLKPARQTRERVSKDARRILKFTEAAEQNIAVLMGKEEPTKGKISMYKDGFVRPKLGRTPIVLWHNKKPVFAFKADDKKAAASILRELVKSAKEGELNYALYTADMVRIAKIKGEQEQLEATALLYGAGFGVENEVDEKAATLLRMSGYEAPGLK